MRSLFAPGEFTYEPTSPQSFIVLRVVPFQPRPRQFLSPTPLLRPKQESRTDGRDVALLVT